MALLSPANCFRALLVAALAVSPGRTQEDNVFYSRQMTFRIPFQVDPGDRRVQKVLLSVSEDNGRTFQPAGEAAPAANGFLFRARHDGWYYFGVQTRDQERRLYPPSLEGTAPGLRVLVDTVPPDVVLRPLKSSRPNEIGVEWDIRDDNLDLSTLTLHYRGDKQDWVPRNLPRQLSGQFYWDPGLAGPVEVRLQVQDKAKNLGEATVWVRGEGTPVHRGDPGPVRAEPSLPRDVRKVNSTRISLNYKVDDVGPSGVKAVEVWMTRDTQDWKLQVTDTTRNPPVVVDVGTEGRYGFTLIARSGVDLAEQPPQKGEPPQIWVEVDLTKPTVQIRDVIVGRGADTGKLTIRWQASDKNLSQRPISISYAVRPDEGKWTPISEATGIDNTGQFVWTMPGGVPYEFSVRVEALDEAGNVGEARTPQTVKVDLALPKARVIGIEPAKP
ncbi:MAG: hypothetical protein HYS12_14860 [Planctomycetes bacterium]|nr:hypothetical protein [Planctomycetota bacterium]